MGATEQGSPAMGERNKPIARWCDKCGEPMSAGVRTCPNCGHHHS
ncbi:zinc-ribbon domain-containing protein [Nocardiopsis sp. NPDC058631]